MGQVISFKPKLLEPVEEPKQEKKRRLKGQGSVYLRGNTYWIQYRSDGKVYNESAQTDKKMEAIGYLKKKVGEIALGHSRQENSTRQPLKTFKNSIGVTSKRKGNGIRKGLK